MVVRQGARRFAVAMNTRPPLDSLVENASHWTQPHMADAIAMFDRIRFRLRALFRPSALEREMQAEMQAHLDRRIEMLVAQGISPENARLAARREFGNVGLHQEHAR